MHSLWHIPELLHAILQHVPRKDLFSVLLVSRIFSSEVQLVILETLPKYFNLARIYRAVVVDERDGKTQVNLDVRIPAQISLDYDLMNLDLSGSFDMPRTSRVSDSLSRTATSTTSSESVPCPRCYQRSIHSP